jgi:GH43 family beta-xylosidase
VRKIVNPLVAEGADPWVVRWRDAYYYCHTDVGDRICVRESADLAGIGAAAKTTVWSAPPGTGHSRNLWAPELHQLDGRWYSYFAADDGDNANHRMYVLASTGPDPMGPYDFVGRIHDPADRWAIDGTVLELAGRRYFIWSGWAGAVDGQQNLYIAPMASPVRLAGDRQLISTPELPWERVGIPLINEGPQVLQHRGRLFLIYSASGSWTDDYCLGQLTHLGGDPLRADSWRKEPAPVFARTDEVFGPGHASFVLAGDGGHDWIVYHAARSQGSGWDRDVRTQTFSWNGDGAPHFGTPVPPGIPVG